VVTKDILRFCGLKSKAYSVGWSNELNERQKEKYLNLLKRIKVFNIGTHKILQEP